MAELFLSLDIEADGPVPGINSMLSMGLAAYTPEKELVGSFERNLLPLPGAEQNPRTMDWWKENPRAWDEVCKSQIPAEQAIRDLMAWRKKLPKAKQTIVAYPAGFDFTYLTWYVHKFNDWTPFSWSSLDIKSYAMAVLKNKSYRATTKRKTPKHWFGPSRHTHIALDDAMEQGEWFLNMYREQLGLPRVRLIDRREELGTLDTYRG